MKARFAALLCLCAFSAISIPLAMAQVAGGPAAAAQPITVRGSITSFNLNNRGLPESFMLIAGPSVGQVNFHSDLSDTLSRVLKINDTVDVTLYEDTSVPAGRAGPDHKVYTLITLKDATGKTYTNPTTPDRSIGHLDGTIVAVNYDRKGMPNGVQLNSGDMIRFSSRDVQGMSIARGVRISADGPVEQMATGRLSMTSATINGGAAGQPTAVAGPGTGQRRGGGAGGGPGGGGRGRGRTGGGAGGGPGGGFGGGAGGGQPTDNGGGTGFDPGQDTGGGDGN